MLALMLSGVVGLASLVFFGSAFFAPKLHRKDDFLWSGFGFFYALVLWICAQRFTGAILLGQLAGVCLILAFAWQTLRLRATIAKHDIADIASFSLLDWVGGGLKRQPKAPKVQPPPATPAPAIATEETVETIEKIGELEKNEETVAEKAIEKVDQVLESIEAPAPVVEAVEEIVQEAIAETEAKIETGVDATEAAIPESAQPEITYPSTPSKGAISKQPKTKTTKNAPPSGSGGDRPKPKSKLFQWLFGGKKQPNPTVQPSNIAEVIEAGEDDWGEEENPVVDQVVTTVEEMAEVVVAEQESIEALITEPKAVVEELEELEEFEEFEDVEKIVTVVEETVAETLQPVENVVDSAIALESPMEVASPVETEEVAAESLEVTEVPEVIEADSQPEPSPEPEPLVVDETVNADNTEPENPTSETEKAADLPVIPVTTAMVEDSNWDDFDQEFDPYFGGDDASTKLENQISADTGTPSETEAISDATTVETDTKTVDPD
jgi:hypothetical protein